MAAELVSKLKITGYEDLVQKLTASGVAFENLSIRAAKSATEMEKATARAARAAALQAEKIVKEAEKAEAALVRQAEKTAEAVAKAEAKAAEKARATAAKRFVDRIAEQEAAAARMEPMTMVRPDGFLGRGFDNALRAMSEGFHAFGQQASSVMQRVSQSVQSITGPLRSVATLLGGLGIGLAGAFVYMAKGALDASMENDRVRISLEAMTGSAEEAARKLAYVHQVDIPSNYNFEQLSKAGVTLEAFGLRIERTLNTAAKLGTAFDPSGQSQHLEEAIRIMGEMKAGRVPEIRQLSEVGLSKQDFQKQGISDLKSATPVQMLEALEKIVDTKYGDMLDRMGHTTASKLASLETSWQMAQITIGGILGQHLGPIIDTFTAKLNSLNENGSIARWAESISTSFNLALPLMNSFFDKLDEINNSGGLENFFRDLTKNVLSFANQVLGFVAIIATVIAAAQALTGNIIGAVVTTAAAAAAAMGVKGTADAIKGIEAVESRTKSNADMDKAFPGMAAKAAKDPQLPPREGGFTTNDAELSAAQSTAANTAMIAHNTSRMLDLRRYVVGGGDRAGIGVTPAELGRAHSYAVTVNGGSNRKLNEALADLFVDFLYQANRQGLVPHGG